MVTIGTWRGFRWLKLKRKNPPTLQSAGLTIAAMKGLSALPLRNYVHQFYLP